MDNLATTNNVAAAFSSVVPSFIGLKRVGGAGALFLLRLETVDFGAAPVEGRFAVQAGVLMGAPPPPLPLAGGFPLPAPTPPLPAANLPLPACSE